MDSQTPPWFNKEQLASDPELRVLQLRWATDDLWIRRVEVGAAVVAALALLATVIVILLAHPEAPLWYGLPPGVGLGFGSVALVLRRIRRKGPRGEDHGEEKGDPSGPPEDADD